MDVNVWAKPQFSYFGMFYLLTARLLMKWTVVQRTCMHTCKCLSSERRDTQESIDDLRVCEATKLQCMKKDLGARADTFKVDIGLHTFFHDFADVKWFFVLLIVGVAVIVVCLIMHWLNDNHIHINLNWKVIGQMVGDHALLSFVDKQVIEFEWEWAVFWFQWFVNYRIMTTQI